MTDALAGTPQEGMPRIVFLPTAAGSACHVWKEGVWLEAVGWEAEEADSSPGRTPDILVVPTGCAAPDLPDPFAPSEAQGGAGKAGAGGANPPLLVHAGDGFTQALNDFGFGGLDAAHGRELVLAYLQCQHWQHGDMWLRLALGQAVGGVQDGLRPLCLSRLGWAAQECGVPVGLLAHGDRMGAAGVGQERDALRGAWDWWAAAAARDAHRARHAPAALLDAFLGWGVLAVDGMAQDSGGLREWLPLLAGSDEVDAALADSGRLAVGLPADALVAFAGMAARLRASRLARLVVQAVRPDGDVVWVPGVVWPELRGRGGDEGGYRPLRALAFKGKPCGVSSLLGRPVRSFGALQFVNAAAHLWSLCWLRACLGAGWPLRGRVLPG